MAKRMKNLAAKIIVTGIDFVWSIFATVAPLTIMLDLPFWPTYSMVAVSGVTISLLQKNWILQNKIARKAPLQN